MMTVGALATPDSDGLIGEEILRRFTVVLDYQRGKIILQPNEHFSDPYSMGGYN